MCNHIWADIPLRYVNTPTRSTQPCIPVGSPNRVPALISWGKGGWQVTMCDPIWHASSRSGEASCITALPVYLYFSRLHQVRVARIHLEQQLRLFIRRRSRLVCYTVKKYPYISTDILWRVFHILTEPVPYAFVSVNRRNNEAQCWPECIYGYFLQCTEHCLSLIHI